MTVYDLCTHRQPAVAGMECLAPGGVLVVVHGLACADQRLVQHVLGHLHQFLQQHREHSTAAAEGTTQADKLGEP